MLENPNNTNNSNSSSSNTNDSSSSTSANIKRYAPPNQRNRSLGRRKSGGAGPDRVDRSSIYLNESEKNQILASRSVPVVDHRDAGSSNLMNENSHARLISLHGCCGSEAFQLLNDRWEAAINEFNNPSIDLAERPTMYSGNGASAWGHFRLPHQLVSASGGPSSGSQMDFVSELKRAMRNANKSV